MTLLIVTVVSLLLYLPWVVTWLNVAVSKPEILRSLCPSVHFHLKNAMLVLFYANSLANPIIYAIRMPEYRSAFLQSSANDLSNKDKLKCYLFVACNTLKELFLI